MQKTQVKHLNTLAGYVYEAHSRVVQDCWELEGLCDVDYILCADTIACRGIAEYISREIFRKFSHEVKIHSNALLCNIRSREAARGVLRRDYQHLGRCLFVTDLASRQNLERQAEKMNLNIKLFHIELFDNGFFCSFWNPGRFDIYDRIRIKKAEKLFVLDSDLNGWALMSYLHSQLQKEYNMSPQIILLKDDEEALFNMENLFLSYMREHGIDERLEHMSVQQLLAAKDRTNGILILPQYKSWLADKRKTTMLFVYSCPLELGCRRNIPQERWYKRILRMAEQHLDTLDADSFVRAYQPKKFSKVRYALYRWIQRIELFVWHRI